MALEAATFVDGIEPSCWTSFQAAGLLSRSQLSCAICFFRIGSWNTRSKYDHGLELGPALLSSAKS